MIRNILEEYQLPTIGDGELDGIIKTNYLSSADHAYLIGNQYFFKEDIDISYFLKERLVEIIANNEGIPTVQTEYVKVGPYYGELTQNFHQEGYNYYRGEEILTHYSKEYQINNLETIAEALRTSFKVSNEDLKRIMDQFLHRLLLDILTMQSDRTSNGWEIEESPHGDIDLTPLFDSNKSFQNYQLHGNQEPFKIKLDFDVMSANLPTYEKIEYLLAHVSSDIVMYWDSLLEKYPPMMIKTYLQKIQKEVSLDCREYMNQILDDYTVHYSILVNMKERRRGVER